MKSITASASSDPRQGSALVLALIFVAISTLLAAGVLRAALSHRLVATAQLRLEQATYVAEAALAEAAQRLIEANGFMDRPTTYGSGGMAGATYGYRIEELEGWKQFSLHATGTVQGVSRRVDVANAYFPTFANYAMWSRVNGVIYYFPGEVMSGKVHSDDKLWFSSSEALGGPVFSNKVTSAHEEYGGSISHVDFQEGYERGVSNGSLASVDFSWLKTRASTAGILLEGATEVQFDGNMVRITNPRKGWVDHPVTLRRNELIYVADATSGDSSTQAGKVKLKGGTLNGRMTLVSDDDMSVQNHIRYANDPRGDNADTGDVSTDALGLISKDDVWIETTAPNNLELFAAILATGQRPNDDGSFGALNYNSGSPRGDLTLYGSLVQEVRGYVNTHGSTGLRTGYRKNYAFDPRFQRSSPPYYPEIGNRIEFEGWTDGPVE